MIISFIIPVYNTAKYLDKCFASILNQGIDEETFEVIIINDGSTDNSEQIINEWRQKIKHYKIIHTPNNGLGSARNIGINISVGKYIFFVDSDDYILDRSLKKLFASAESSDIDIIGFNWEFVYANGKTSQQKGNKIPYDSILSGAEYMSQYSLKAGVCFYLYKGDFLRKTPLLMPEGIYHEDELFLPKAFTYAKQIVFVDQTIYAYCQREDSITNQRNSDFLQKRIDDSFFVLDELMSLSQDSSLSPLQKEGLKRKVSFFTVDIILNLFRFQVDDNLVKQVLGRLGERNLYPLVKNTYGLKYTIFRAVFNSSKNISIALKLGFFSKK